MNDKETLFLLKSSGRMKQEKNGSHKKYKKIFYMSYLIIGSV